ncbi:hypothetical protein [Turicibacter sanguinis]|uniref:hypothetical protein n=1 Tax=Turicibacter sanguinis TaxID=154288 RepID=UPI0012BCB57E|nr:hypothetical protein [Turicibacter sanguinis]MDB8439122.1 hypothetical protein [Turicibacter sanguinis]MTO25049.1 hypothetical protein [Turicibacter sanguinis]MTO27895.1 hypothetical protein [Turicibacter sanguinis]MTO90810.1 hypothetical protein [Turicibacter sanguinis]MTP71070.1 hypothetical protein [Turicibacter sanguinis]
MGEYVKKKKDMKFSSQDALKTVQSVIDDADIALNDKSRRIADSPISEVLAGTAGIGVGAGIGFAGLYLGGSVVGLSAAGLTSGLAAAGALIGGGMAAGIAVLAAPAVILGGAGVGIASHVKNKKLKDAKELVYKNAIAKQTAIIKALEEESDADKDRIDYLNGLNVLLQAAIEDLRYDLGIISEKKEELCE